MKTISSTIKPLIKSGLNLKIKLTFKELTTVFYFVVNNLCNLG